MYGVDSHDSCTFDGATRLAAKVREYWSRRGKAVEVWVDRIDNVSDGQLLYCVRSNLFGGKPR